MLLLDRRGGLFRASHLGDDLARLGELLDQLATLLSQLRELDVLLLELVVQLLFLAGRRIQLLLRGVHFLVRLGGLLLARLDLLLQLVLALGEHPDQIVLFLQLPRDGVALGPADRHPVFQLLDLPQKRLGLPAPVGLDGRLHPLALPLQLGRRVVRLLLVELLAQALQLLVALLEQAANLFRVGAGRRRGLVRHLLLHLLHQRLELAVLLLEERDLAAKGGDLHLVRSLHFGPEWRGALPRLVGDDAFGRRRRSLRAGRVDPHLGNVAHERGPRHAEGDEVAVLEALAVDVAVIDEGAVGRSEIHQEILAVLAPDLRVFRRHPGVGNPDVASRGPSDGHRVGTQLDLLAFQGPVQDAQQCHGNGFLRAECRRRTRRR